MKILLIHGLFGSLSDESIVNAFDSAATVIAPDLLGYGQYLTYDTANLTLVHQAQHLASLLKKNGDAPVHIVGHSVGGAVGLLLASDHPELVASYTSVEGNMTLKDAFWSAEIANTPIAKVEQIIEGYKADAAAWIAGAGVEATPERLSIAKQWLDNQPATTIKAQATAVVNETGKGSYLERFNTLKANGTPIYLLAGESSYAEWDLPQSILNLSSSSSKAERCGHLMMLENPSLFAKLVFNALD